MQYGINNDHGIATTGVSTCDYGVELPAILPVYGGEFRKLENCTAKKKNPVKFRAMTQMSTGSKVQDHPAGERSSYTAVTILKFHDKTVVLVRTCDHKITSVVLLIVSLHLMTSILGVPFYKHTVCRRFYNTAT